jgi:hypothetical protein
MKINSRSSRCEEGTEYSSNTAGSSKLPEVNGNGLELKQLVDRTKAARLAIGSFWMDRCYLSACFTYMQQHTRK